MTGLSNREFSGTTMIAKKRRGDESRQDEQSQGRGAQMGDLIDGPGGPHAERNPAVGRVECQRDRGQQQQTSPPLDRLQYCVIPLRPI